MNNKQYFLQKIPKIIQEAKSVPGWSISDYLNPIRKLYSELPQNKKRYFHSSLIELLRGREYLEDIITICKEIELKEACEVLIVGDN